MRARLDSCGHCDVSRTTESAVLWRSGPFVRFNVCGHGAKRGTSTTDDGDLRNSKRFRTTHWPSSIHRLLLHLINNIHPGLHPCFSPIRPLPSDAGHHPIPNHRDL